jgi:hypothetical protein
MSQLFKLQNHCSTQAVQLLVQEFHLVFLPLVTCAHPLWCSTLEYTQRGVSSVRDVLLAVIAWTVMGYGVKPDDCV